ncbi:MAG: hypothetical protein RIC80_17845 [Cyclobacteriaceae bacterium]
MKNYFSKLIALGLFLAAGTFGHQANAEEITPMSKKDLRALSEVEVEERVKMLESRVQEINAMDLSTMTRAEKRDVRKELREIQKENKTMAGGGIYLSVGAIIIIILLLILLL